MLYILLGLMIVLLAVLTFLMLELNWSTGEWKNARYKNNFLPVSWK